MIDWTAIGSIATAIAVLVGAWQVRRNTRQAVTDFEDEFTREYRNLIKGLSVEAQLGLDDPNNSFEKDYSLLVSYIDLSNEQVFLRQCGRVSRDTWENWRDGIRENLAKPAFARAWQQIKAAAPDSFAELRKLDHERFATDPRKWVSNRQRFRRWLTAG